MILEMSKNRYLNDALNALVLSVLLVIGRLLCSYLTNMAVFGPRIGWFGIALELTVYTFGCWILFAALSQRREYFEIEQAFYRRKGRAAVMAAEAAKKKQENSLYGPRSFRRKSLGLK